LPDTQDSHKEHIGGTVTNDGSNTIHTFNSSGNFYTGSLATGGDTLILAVIILFTHLLHQEHLLQAKPFMLTI
jgi:hypothetical protein